MRVSSLLLLLLPLQILLPLVDPVRLLPCRLQHFVFCSSVPSLDCHHPAGFNIEKNF